MTENESRSRKGQGKSLEVPDLDLLIIDLDDTFVYHRTVAIANKIYLDSWRSLFRRKPKKERLCKTKGTLARIMALLAFQFYRYRKDRVKKKRVRLLTRTAISLHMMNLRRNLRNHIRFLKLKSSEKMIRKWADTVVKLGIPAQDYQIPEELVAKKLNKRMMLYYSKIREKNKDMKIVAITQHFNISKDPLEKILRLDKIVSNRFIVDHCGNISGYDIRVKDQHDKLAIAQELAKAYAAKSIGLIIEDYDDAALLKMDGLKFALYKRRLKRFVPKKGIISKGF